MWRPMVPSSHAIVTGQAQMSELLGRRPGAVLGAEQLVTLTTERDPNPPACHSDHRPNVRSRWKLT